MMAVVVGRLKPLAFHYHDPIGEATLMRRLPQTFRGGPRSGEHCQRPRKLRMRAAGLDDQIVSLDRPPGPDDHDPDRRRHRML